jgi:hypothetical protein
VTREALERLDRHFSGCDLLLLRPIDPQRREHREPIQPTTLRCGGSPRVHELRDVYLLYYAVPHMRLKASTYHGYLIWLAPEGHRGPDAFGLLYVSRNFDLTSPLLVLAEIEAMSDLTENVVALDA